MHLSAEGERGRKRRKNSSTFNNARIYDNGMMIWYFTPENLQFVTFMSCFFFSLVFVVVVGGGYTSKPVHMNSTCFYIYIKPCHRLFIFEYTTQIH